MNKKHTYFKSIFVLVIILVGFAGATYAWFTDSVTNQGNRIQAGNLKVALEASDAIDGTYRDVSGTADPIFLDNQAEPGISPMVTYLKITNTGNIAMDYRVAFSIIEEGLAEAISFEIEKVHYAGLENDYTKQNLTGDLISTHYLSGTALGNNIYEIYKITLVLNADNSYNLDTDDMDFPLAFEFDITLHGWQNNAPNPFE